MPTEHIKDIDTRPDLLYMCAGIHKHTHTHTFMHKRTQACKNLHFLNVTL